ncbi:MAG: hypothetical protein QOH32_4310 [Bradyrhizobium sp.]|jgi:hypothetical protein|nr:hypothetical protein [Bradyrhizobium sp.]
MDRTDFIIRSLTQLLVGILTACGIYVAYFYWGGLDTWKVVIGAVVPMVCSWFLVIGAAVALWNRNKATDHERPFVDVMVDLGTDVLVAVFLSISVGILVACVINMEVHSELYRERLDQYIHEGKLDQYTRAFIHEPIKEGIYAGSVALVSFAALIMLRAALSVQHMGELGLILAQTKSLQGDALEIHDRALKLSAESGAGTALAGLIEQIPPVDVRSAIWKEQREILTAAGTSAQYWISYAAEDARADDAEQARPIVRFTAAKAFLRESASDMARQERLAVSNIRYVTSLVCSTLITLQKLAEQRGAQWRPVWFGLTTYSPDLWFEDPQGIERHTALEDSGSKRFLEDSGLPSRTMHLQYWGRYLRNLRYLMQGTRAPISLRVFSSKDADFDQQKEDFKNMWVLDCLHPYNNGGDESRLTQFVPGTGRYQTSRQFAQQLAEKLAWDAALSITNEKFLQTERGGELKDWLHALYRLPNKTEQRLSEFLQVWHREHSGRISEIVRASFEEMHAWELAYFSQWPNANGPTIRAEKAEEFISKKTNEKVVLEYVDGNPLEVLLDALLLYCDAIRDDGMAKTASSLLVERWHREMGSRACRIAKPATEPSEFLTPEQMLDGLVFNLPEHGDVHAFGLVPVSNHATAKASVEWDKAEWLLAAKSGMSSLLGIARVDFLEIHHPGQISLTELKNPIGQRSRAGDLVSLSNIVAGLAARQEETGKKFEVLR